MWLHNAPHSSLHSSPHKSLKQDTYNEILIFCIYVIMNFTYHIWFLFECHRTTRLTTHLTIHLTIHSKGTFVEELMMFCIYAISVDVRHSCHNWSHLTTHLTTNLTTHKNSTSVTKSFRIYGVLNITSHFTSQLTARLSKMKYIYN